MFTGIGDDNKLQIIQHIVEVLYIKTYEYAKDITVQKYSIQEYQLQLHAPYIVLNPEKSVTNGIKKRIKGNFEKRRQTTTKNKEFGSKTQNKHII